MIIVKRSSIEFINKVSSIVKAQKKYFGTNSYDPKLNDRIVYGFDTKQLSNLQDYLLFENHNHPSLGTYNQAVYKYAEYENKPVFNLVYKKGIGYDSSYTQEDFENQLTEADNNKVSACFKGSEFTSDGVWHNLDISKYNALEVSSDLDLLKDEDSDSIVLRFLIIATKVFGIQFIIDYIYSKLFNLIMNNKLFRPAMNLVYKYVIR